MVTSKAIISGILLTSIVAFASISLGLMISANADMENSSYEFLIELGLNWSQGPISSIVVSDKSVCNTGTSNFVTDSWPGTVVGCRCSKSTTRGSCKKSRTTKNCPDLNPVNEIAYTVWEGSVLCKKQSSQNYLDLTLVSKTSCPVNTKMCGVADIHQNFLCTPNNEDCPVNDVQFLNKDVPTPSGYVSVALDSNKKLVYTNTLTDRDLPIFTRVRENQPCSDKAEYNSKFTNSFILDKFYYSPNSCATTIAGFKEDNTYKVIDSYSYYDLLNLNGVLVAVTNLGTYPTPDPSSNLSINLYIKNYIGLRQDCKAKVLQAISNNTKDFIQNLQLVGINSNEAINNFGTTLSISAISVGICGLYLIFAIVFRCDQKRHGDNCIFKILVLFCFVGSLAMTAISSVFSFIYYSKVDSIGNAHTLLNGCLDNASNELINVYATAVESVKMKALSGAIISLISFIISIVETTLFYLLKDEETESNDNQVSQNSLHKDERELRSMNFH